MTPFFQKFLLTVAACAALGATVRADLNARPKPGLPGRGADAGRSRIVPQTWLGVAIAEAPVEISGRLPIEPGTGLVVDQVIADSPAAIAGVQRGDVLARLNDQTLVTPKQLQTLVMHRKPGDQVELTFFRKGEKQRVVVVLMLRERL